MSEITKELIIPSERIPEAEKYYADYVNNPGHDQVAAVFGVELSQDDVEARAAGIRDVSDKYADSRNGQERQNANPNEHLARQLKPQELPEGASEAARADEKQRAEETTAKFFAGLNLLGHKGTQPIRRGEADTVTILGGMAEAMVTRALFAATNGRQELYSGSERPLGDAEKAFLEKYNIKIDEKLGFTESSAGLAILKYRHPKRETVQDDKRVKAFKTAQGLIFWTNAPVIEGGGPNNSRANTRDTYRFSASELGVDLGNRLLAATNDFFRPFQGIDAYHIMRAVAGMHAAGAAGFDPEYAGAVLRANGFDIATKNRADGPYLQEWRSADMSARALKATIDRSRERAGL